MASTFENLPLIVLELVCEHLVAVDKRRSGLFALSLTSRRCCEVADRTRFERIHVEVNNTKKLVQFLSRWNEILTFNQSNRYRYIRRLKVSGRMQLDLTQHSSDAIDESSNILDESDESGFLEPEDGEDELSDSVSVEDSDDEDVLRHARFCRKTNMISLPTPNRFAAIDDIWKLVDEFISKCVGLKCLVWNSYNQVPRRIIETLRKDLPAVRLQVNTFDLRSLHQWPNKPHDIDDDEYALVASPSLDSVRAESHYFGDEGNLDYKEEAIIEMIRGESPNLRSVHITYRVLGGSLGLQQALGAGRPSWPGFYANKGRMPTESRGHLKDLTMTGYEWNIGRIEQFVQSTEFSELQTLKMIHDVRIDALEYLNEMAMRNELKSLRNLSIGICVEDDVPEAAVPALVQLLTNLQSLEALHLQATINHDLIFTLNLLHGRSLRKLHLTHCMTNEFLQKCQESCPNLEYAKLKIRRRQGNETEIETYRILGSFRKIDRLVLNLDCEAEDLVWPSEGTKDQRREFYAEEIRIQLINVAVDEKLARSICSVIYGANRAAHPGVLPTLQYIKLYSRYVHSGVQLEFMKGYISRSWLSERVGSGMGMGPDEFVLRETRKKEAVMVRRNFRELIMYDDDEADYPGFQNMNDDDDDDDDGNDEEILRKLYKPVWEELWPESKGKKNWADFWHSFPLVEVP